MIQMVPFYMFVELVEILAVVNEDLEIQICKTCNYTKDNEDIFKIKSSYANRLFMQELQSMGVGIKMNLKPYEFSEYL